MGEGGPGFRSAAAKRIFLPCLKGFRGRLMISAGNSRLKILLYRPELRTEPASPERAVGVLGRALTVMHNSHVVSVLNFGKKERSRCRLSWAERREGDRKARLGVLQEAPSKAKES